MATKKKGGTAEPAVAVSPAAKAAPATPSEEDFYKMKYHQLQERVKQLERELAEQKKLTQAADARARRARGAFENAMRTMERLKGLVEME